MSKNYSAADIQVLQGIEPIRLRPAMFIGDTGSDGLHHILRELLDNAVDEFLDGHVTKIDVTLLPTGAIVQDNGRGIPVEVHPQTGLSTLETVFTKMHAGGKFKKGAYTAAVGGLHGVGATATCALSSSFIATSVREGKAWQQQYCRGIPTTKVERVSSDQKSGVKVEFYPDVDIFGKWLWQPKVVSVWLRDIAWLCSGLELSLTVGDKVVNYRADDGLVGLLKSVTADQQLQSEIFSIQSPEFDLAWVWTEAEGEHWRSWVNVVHTPSHGTHVAGVKRAVQDFLLSLTDLKVRGDYLREGLVGAVHARVMEPQFQGQIKSKLENKETEQAIYKVVLEYLQQNRQRWQSTLVDVIDRAKQLQDAKQKFRVQQQAAKHVKVSKGARGILPGKLCEAPDCDPEDREIFIVEGDSAFGSAKDARIKKRYRDREVMFQEILPLKGKSLNAAKGDLEEVMNNKELSSIAQAIGTGVEPSFDLRKCRCGSVFLLADADPDGKHITALILAFFALHMPQLIESGRVKVILAPLFRGVSANQTAYGDTIEEVKQKLNSAKNIRLSRFKGLGEANPEDLEIFAMTPKSRRVYQVTWGGAEDKALVLKYMGDGTAARKELLGVQ
jgi:DNA gyrase subunit B